MPFDGKPGAPLLFGMLGAMGGNGPGPGLEKSSLGAFVLKAGGATKAVHPNTLACKTLRVRIDVENFIVEK